MGFNVIIPQTVHDRIDEIFCYIAVEKENPDDAVSGVAKYLKERKLFQRQQQPQQQFVVVFFGTFGFKFVRKFVFVKRRLFFVKFKFVFVVKRQQFFKRRTQIKKTKNFNSNGL